MNAVCHEQFELESLFGKKLTGGFDGGSISSDGGSLVLRELDLRYGVTKLMARSLLDRRAANRVHHGLETLLKQRVYGIALGCEDANDHDRLRYDPALKAAC
ncbi:transposase, partial [Desulfobulbus sp.]